MSYYNIYGTGGVVFQDLITQGLYIYFPTAIATLSKVKIDTTLTGNLGGRITKLKGWRVLHLIKINNYCLDDYINIVKLLHNISYMTNQTGLDKTMYYYPKVNQLPYTGFLNDYKKYRIICDKMTVQFDRITNSLLTGLTATFKFLSYGLLNDLNIYTSINQNAIVTDNNLTLQTDNGLYLIYVLEV